MGMQSGLWCPRCVRRRIREHGRFNGTEGLGRAVPGLVFNDEEICSGCADELLAPILEDEHDSLSGDPIPEQNVNLGRIS